MTRSQMPAALILGGVGLLVFAVVWPKLVGGTMAYDDDDAKEYQQASMDLHAHVTAHAHDDNHANENATDEHAGLDHGSESDDSALRAAQERMTVIQDKRDSALTRGQSTSTVFKWLGMLVAVVGIVTHFIFGDGEEE